MAETHLAKDSDDKGAQDINDVKLSLEAMTMLLNNNWEEAQSLFSRYKETSAIMNAGSSMVTFMQALMSFEEERLAEAVKALEETEKRCRAKDGFCKKENKKSKKVSLSTEEKLQRQILIADCIIYQAVLTFINQDITSLIKGGWMMRKAWKIYDKVYRDCKMLYDSCDALKTPAANPSSPVPPTAAALRASFPSDDSPQEEGIDDIAEELGASGGEPSETGSLHSAASSKGEISMDGVSSLVSSHQLTPDVIARLLASVSFGYGTFQLCLSLIPPKILKIIEFLGFEGDRNTGLECLDFCSYSKDMKAPLASLGLVWYHTVIRPFFALDGGNLDAGVEDAMQIIERCEKEYPESSLFLFFKGRAQRLKSELDESLATYNQALKHSVEQREMKLICLHETGWIHMMKLNWKEAAENFFVLQSESRWSKSYYAYLTGLCFGAQGNEAQAKEEFDQVPKLVKRKNNQIEAFALKRASRFKKHAISKEYCSLLLLEVLYLWNALPQCPKDCVTAMMEVCNAQTDKKVYHLRSLVEGSLYREQGDDEMALQCFDEAVARQSGMKDDHYVAAYATYEMGVMLSQSSTQFQEGKTYLTKAKDNYKDYDFDNRLNVRIQAALRRLKEEGTPI